MIRLSRALKENTAYAMTFASLIALVACSSEDEPGTSNTSGAGATGQSTDPVNGGGAPSVGTTPSGEGNPVGAPLDPGTAGQGGGTNTDPLAPSAFVEDNGEGCVVPALPGSADLQDIPTLPDPFLGLNGERLTSKAQWRCRREEIKSLAERFIYGEKPAKPEGVTGTVSGTSITVNIGEVTFGATVELPPGATGPVPAVIGYGGSVFRDAMLQEGVAFINFNVTAVGDETTNRPKVGAFYTVNPEFQDTGMLVAWAWGVSRIIDVIEASGAEIINPQGIGVTGCSRSGKGAFIAGAFDERVALTIPLESGMAGVPAFRLIVPEGGEVLRNAYEYRPWAGEAYRQFLSLVATSEADIEGRALDQMLSGQLQSKLPIDTHEVIGMVAPRGLLVLGNPGIVNLAPAAEHVTVLAGKEIYSALGVGENLSYISNTTIGDHCGVLRPEYVPLLQQNLRKFLKGDASATTGEINPDPRLTGQLAANIAWETPALE
jgi:glucuronyl esterase-like protein